MLQEEINTSISENLRVTLPIFNKVDQILEEMKSVNQNFEIIEFFKENKKNFKKLNLMNSLINMTNYLDRKYSRKLGYREVLEMDIQVLMEEDRKLEKLVE